MLKQGIGKVGLGSSIVQNAKTRYSWEFILFKMLKLGTMESYIVENAKRR